MTPPQVQAEKERRREERRVIVFSRLKWKWIGGY
jgi:hypothetical protein